MMSGQCTEEQIDKLRPYFAGKASAKGEVDTYCPLHEDLHRSAQTNIVKGVFFCNAGCGGMTVDMLIENEGYWYPPTRDPSAAPFTGGTMSDAEVERESVTIRQIRKWHDALMDDEDDAGTRLWHQRGIARPTAVRYELGWDGLRRVYTIPVRSAKGKLWNVRRYDMFAPGDRRKIWGLRGNNKPRLYPALALKAPGPIIICEGEWDALLTIQNGFLAITRTGPADCWVDSWSRYFQGRDVYLCHDLDTKGDTANKKIRKKLKPFAENVRIIHLPMPFSDKHGMDLTDYWLENHKPFEFEQLMKAAV